MISSVAQKGADGKLFGPSERLITTLQTVHDALNNRMNYAIIVHTSFHYQYH